ncbi:hypothetical protein FA95DRAFT_1606123 [Auriscalpium vulgare]|uniref:Uncharacterized protein n=1 Tax=Auriscalpium vulgare TaxID=40419 RepID=A0ACB8RTI3_9AGAM|nr:hypothetical protein FA95DRAFT_1606123 [Auriscalpium vulgare]
MAPSVLAAFNRGGTIGVEYLGVVFSSILYGVSCLQMFQYFRSEKARSDVWWIKAMVVILFAFDTTHEAFVIHVSYHYLITNYDDPEALLKNIWSIPFSVTIHAIIAFVTNCFFVYRIWKLSANKFVSAFCVSDTSTASLPAHLNLASQSATGVAGLVSSLVFTIQFYLVQDLVEAITTLKFFQSTGILSVSLSAAAGVLRSATLTFYLHTNRTGFRHSNDVITKLSMLVLGTGTVTTLFLIAELISYVAAPDLLYVLLFEFVTSKLYVNSVLTCLNMREHIRNLSDHGVNSIHLSRIRHEGSKHERQQVVNLSSSPMQSNPVDPSIKFQNSYSSSDA